MRFRADVTNSSISTMITESSLAMLLSYYCEPCYAESAASVINNSRTIQLMPHTSSSCASSDPFLLDKRWTYGTI